MTKEATNGSAGADQSVKYWRSTSYLCMGNGTETENGQLYMT